MTSNAQLNYVSTDRVRRNTYSLAAKRSIVREAGTNFLQIKAVAKSHSVRKSHIRSWAANFAAHDILVKNQALLSVSSPTVVGISTNFINAAATPTSETIRGIIEDTTSPDFEETVECGVAAVNDTCDETVASSISTLSCNGYLQEVLPLPTLPLPLPPAGTSIQVESLNRITRVLYNRTVTRRATRLAGAGRPRGFSDAMYDGL